MFRALAISLFVFFAVSPAVQAQTIAADFSVAIDGDFSESDIRFTGELGVVYRFMWDVRAVNGQIAVCGTGVFLRARARSAVRGMLRDGYVEYAGVRILEDLSYFTRANTVNAMRAGQANCRYAADSTRRSGPLTLVFGDGVVRY